MDTGFSEVKRVRTRITAKHLRYERINAGALYRTVRARLALSQEQLGRLLGLTRDAVMSREVRKRQFTLGELIKLQEVSGLQPAEFWELLVQTANM